MNIKKTETNQNVPVSLRSKEAEIFYISSLRSGQTKDLITEERIKEWKYWVIIENAFPYNYAFKTHHLLIPKRVVPENELSKEETEELKLIYEELSTIYDCRIINFKRKQSIKSHFHVHLLKYKDHRQDLEP